MKRLVLIFLMMASPALAHGDECDVFTNETRPAGEVTAKISDWELTITDQYTGTREYRLVSAGTRSFEPEPGTSSQRLRNEFATPHQSYPRSH